MGTTVLDSGVPVREGLHLYAHCLAGQSGGVTLLAINNSRSRAESIEVPMAARRYTLAAQKPEDEQVLLNGRPLKAAADGGLPPLEGQDVPAGRVELPPVTISFLAVPQAQNPSCR
jgi:hypothetical protein